jgi:Flp pilus assembly protein TadD
MENLQHRKKFLGLLACTIVLICSLLTYHQLGYWRNNISLYQHTLQVTSNNNRIRNNLGIALANKGHLDAAIIEFKEALRIFPNYAEAHTNLGVALDRKGNLDGAIQEYMMAIRLSPNSFKAHYNLGTAYGLKGDIDAAIGEFQKSLRIKPNDSNALSYLDYWLDLKTRRFQKQMVDPSP